jgi:hypothetical protein
MRILLILPTHYEELLRTQAREQHRSPKAQAEFLLMRALQGDDSPILHYWPRLHEQPVGAGMTVEEG